MLDNEPSDTKMPLSTHDSYIRHWVVVHLIPVPNKPYGFCGR